MTLATLHDQVRESIRAAILGGDLAPNDKIMSEREICEEHGVSRTTARRAIGDLVNEGLLFTVTGKGTFVAERPLRQELRLLVGFAEDLRSQGLEVQSQIVTFDRIEASEAIATALNLRPMAPVTRLSRLRLIAGQPLAIQTSYLPEHLCPGLLHLDFSHRSLFQTLRENYKLNLVGGSTTIKAGLANSEETRLLRLAPPAAVLRTEQCTLLENGDVIELCCASFHGEHFELSQSMGAQYPSQFMTIFSGERVSQT